MIICFRFHNSSSDSIKEQGRAYQRPGHVNGWGVKVDKFPDRAHTDNFIQRTRKNQIALAPIALDGKNTWTNREWRRLPHFRENASEDDDKYIGAAIDGGRDLSFRNHEHVRQTRIRAVQHGRNHILPWHRG